VLLFHHRHHHHHNHRLPQTAILETGCPFQLEKHTNKYVVHMRKNKQFFSQQKSYSERNLHLIHPFLKTILFVLEYFFFNFCKTNEKVCAPTTTYGNAHTLLFFKA
jgi:hypothetical protein